VIFFKAGVTVKVSKVVIDPGHGGPDAGAVGPAGVREKDVTLAVARRTAEYLAGPVAVRLTREGDVALGADDNSELGNRAKVANDWGADLFVSIHCNSAASPEARGTETYFYPGSEEGKKLAAALQKSLVGALKLADRGTKEANFAVLRLTECPAALVELAFISNPQEEALLADPEFQDRAARALAEGTAAYLGVQLPQPQPPSGPEDWKQKIIADAKKAGLITQDHDPDEPAPKWFVLATELRLLEKVKAKKD
jgi:N-acetylmuramoyl-L-alanine amidase